MWITKLIKAGIVLFFAVCAESIRECRSFRVVHYDLDTPKLKNGEKEIKIVFLSDLHNHIYGKDNAPLVDSVRKEKPDLILVGGDMLLGKERVLPSPAVEFMVQLPEIAPVYYSNGNHEQRMKENIWKYGPVFLKYKRKLTDAGIHFLENTSADLEISAMKIRLTGLELPLESYEKLHRYPVTKGEIRRLAGTADKQHFQILLAHNPVYFQAYKKWGADLVLSGHLHGGIARIPGSRGMITPQAFLFPKYSGEMTTEEGKSIIVSKGLGSHTVNLRLFNPPEVVVVHLRPCKNREVPL